ncbi:MAG TPA: hypothetical protein VK211_24670, partial [Kamptonema sp.]|nr:hypothetical protein [Kamptonema sp.]
MMEKVVHLIFDGDMVIGGFRVFLEIKEGDRTLIQIRGSLPPNPELAIAIHEHWRKYGELGLASRITPKSATHNINSSSTNQDTFSTRLQESRQSGEKLRNPINQWLKSEQFRKIDTGLLRELIPTDQVRLLIRTEDNNLRKLPLELWDFMDSYPAANIAISSLECKMPRLLPKIAAKSKVRILAILGCSTNIDVEKDKQLLESLRNAEVVFLDQPKHHEINDKLWEQPWDIIFFAGHSETDGDIGRIY